MRWQFTMARFVECTRAVVQIQATVRAHLASVEYQRLQRSVLLAQCLWRSVVARRRVQSLRSIIIVQAIARGRAVRSQLASLRNAVLLAQSLYRGKLARRHAHVVAAAVVLQKYVRRFLTARYVERASHAAVVVQTAWRAHAARRTYNTTQLAWIKVRLMEANSRATPADIVSVRIAAAVRMLHQQQLTSVKHACEVLARCTQVSWVCCENLLQQDGLSQVFEIIRSCNRSLPNREILVLSLDVVRNVASHPRTAVALISASRLETLLDLVQMYRDKEDVCGAALDTLLMLSSHRNLAQAMARNTALVGRAQQLRDYLLKKAQTEGKHFGLASDKENNSRAIVCGAGGKRKRSVEQLEVFIARLQA